MDFSTPLTYVKGVGPARAAMLEAKGLVTVEALLGYVPSIYEAVSKLTTRVLRTFTHRILQQLPAEPDYLPAFIRQRLRYPDRDTALRHTHFPPPDSDLRLLNNFRSIQQQRLIFEEFFWL